MNFDEIIDRQGTHSSKWDKMEPIYGVPANTGIAMWVADMDFRPPAVVQDALQSMLDHGIYGYFGDDREYLNAIQWWMEDRPRMGLYHPRVGERHRDVCRCLYQSR